MLFKFGVKFGVKMVDNRLVFMQLMLKREEKKLTKVKIKEMNLVGKSLGTNDIWSIKGGAEL